MTDLGPMAVDFGRLAPSAVSNPRTAAMRAEVLAQFHACLAKMRAKDHDLLKQRFLDGIAYPDLAAALKLSEDQVYVNVSRARRLLMECLAKLGIKPAGRKKRAQDSGGKDVSS